MRGLIYLKVSTYKSSKLANFCLFILLLFCHFPLQALNPEKNHSQYFHQTVWFYLLSILVGMAAIWFLFRIFSNRLKRREQVLEKLVAKQAVDLKKVNKLLADANVKLKELSKFDSLTEIYSRKYFEEFLDLEWKRCRRVMNPISLIMVDVDFFKLYNDTYGHVKGDFCLRSIGVILNFSVDRPGDLVARYGGEEFAVILGNTDAIGAKMIAEKIRKNVIGLKIPHKNSKVLDVVSISLGIATLAPSITMTAIELVKLSDKALYRAKETGRNKLIHADDLD